MPSSTLVAGLGAFCHVLAHARGADLAQWHLQTIGAALRAGEILVVVVVITVAWMSWS